MKPKAMVRSKLTNGAKRKAGAALGARQGGPDPKPRDQDDRQAAEQVRPQAQKQVPVARQQVERSPVILANGSMPAIAALATEFGTSSARSSSARSVRASERARLVQKRDVRVDALHGGFASLRRVEQLLLQQRHQHVVRVLRQPRRRHGRRR